MVECECCVEKYGETVIRVVLIDTWWNVNDSVISYNGISETVLIDTWWNVNFALHETEKKYMKVLIDTWWNVN